MANYKHILFIIIVIIVIIVFFTSIVYKEYYNKEYYNKEEVCTAVIVEPRKHKALEFVLSNFMNNLDYHWNFVIMHGTDNKEFVEQILNKFENKSRVKLVNLEVSNLSIYDYNNLLYSEKFYDNIDTEIFLVFQTDTIICNNKNNNINRFLKYDYVGAPWKHMNDVGNGGLSLRRKSKMLEILKNCNRDPHMNEDVFFSFGCDNAKPYKPSVKEAKKFSVESIYEDYPFGHHKSWGHLKEDLEKMRSQCIGYETLEELNS
jgi:hypothetical protein